MGRRAHQAPRGVALALALSACASRQPDPPRQVVWSDPQPSPVVPVAAPATTPAPTPAPTPVAHPMTPAFPVLALDNLRFHEQAECARGECALEALSPFAPSSVAREDGATTLPPAMAWVHVIRPQATLRIPRWRDVDLLGVVLVGDARVERRPLQRAVSQPMTAWTAFFASEGGVVIQSASPSPTALLLVTAATTPGQATVIADTDAPRPTAPVTRDLRTLDDLAWGGGATHARIAFEAPLSTRASLGMLFASDDAPVPEHDHATAWETLAVFSAAGHLHLPAREGDVPLAARDRTVTAGSIVYVPSGVRHGWRPDGTHPLLAVQVYAPGGPEQRFRALAQGGAAPPTTSAPADRPTP